MSVPVLFSLIFLLLLIIIVSFAMYHHQRVLQRRAMLMRAAVRHRDFTFRLPTRGLLFGEKALQDALNDMGQEIQKLVERRETEAWQRLVRVLTHEIRNAATPIQSVSQAYLKSAAIKGSPYEEGIQAIYDTTLGLAAFAEGCRQLTHLPDPQLADVGFLDFCQGVASLYPGLAWQISVPPALMLKADAVLLRQVFINLTKNAVEANARTMGIEWKDGACFVSNDGHAIPHDVAQEMFIPFFTTKASGSGIGLSLSRQLLLSQGMTLTLRPHPLRGFHATFIIEWEG